MTPPQTDRETSNVDPTPLPVRWIPQLTEEEAGAFLAALAKDKSVMPADFCKDEARKACVPYA